MLYLIATVAPTFSAGPVIWVTTGFVGGVIAARRGYPPVIGIIVGTVGGPLCLAAALLLPRTTDKRLQLERERKMSENLKTARKQKTCPECGCTHSVVNNFCPSCMHRYVA